MKAKKMPRKQFTQVLTHEWTPVQLVGDAIPAWLQGIPGDVLHSIYASGTRLPGFEYEGSPVPGGLLIGGIDVYRNAPEDPVEINKDWYAV